jgi:metal-responsive CopG/Arc/MetJ family transcriptional regulator
MANYTTNKLQKDLVEQLDVFLEQQSLGYTSRAELVKDALRSFLTKMRQEKA